MTQPFLYMRNRSSTLPQCAVFKEINRQLVQIGNEFGTTEDGGFASTDRHRSANRVVHWGNDILAQNGDTIYKYNALTAGSGGTGDWEVFYTVANYHGSARAAYVMGLIPCSIDGSGVLLTAYPSASSTSHVRFVKIDKELNVQEGADIQLIGLNNPTNTNGLMFGSPTPYRNTVIFDSTTPSSNQDNVYIYDLKTDSIIELTLNPSSGSGGAVGKSQTALLRDKLFMISQNSDGSSMAIYRIDGGVGNRVAVFSTNHDVNLDGCYAQIAINDKIYVFGDTGNLYRLYEVEFDSSNDVTVINNVTALLPATLKAITPTASSNKALWRVDHVTNGPTNPIYELELSNTDNGTRSLWTWNDAPTGSGWTFQGNAMTGKEYSWIDVTEGSSAPYTWSGSGTLNVSQPCLSISPDSLAITAEFEVFGPVGQSGIALELYFDKEGEMDNTRGSITSTSVGSISGVPGTVIGLSPGDKPLVRWEAVNDGIVGGDNPKVHAKVFIP